MTDIAGISGGPGPATVDTSLVFDLSALHHIVGDAPAILKEIVAVFDAVASDIRVDLLQAATVSDAVGAGMLAHTLKSSARSVGALALGALCERLEERCAAGRRDMVAPMVGDVVDALDAALAAMRAWLGAQAPVAPLTTRYGL